MSAIDDLRETVARLRSPGGCPWDIEQTHESICDCLIEEVAELLDTIDRKDSEHMREELGDVLLHVVMHSQMAEEARQFDFDAVAADINAKLIRRHPHVFGHAFAENSEQVLHVWDQVKSGEVKRGPVNNGVFKHLPPSIPSLLYARDIFKQIVKQMLPAEDVVDFNYIHSLADGLTDATAGRMLFEIAAACRKANIDPESALRRHALDVMEHINARSANKS